MHTAPGLLIFIISDNFDVFEENMFTPPNAADILLAPPPPSTVDRRAATADRNHPARRRRRRRIGVGLYIGHLAIPA